MTGLVDIRDAAASLQALRGPLVAALSGASRTLTEQGMPADQALAWSGAELLAVVASVLDAELPCAADGDPLDQGGPFDMADTNRHRRIEEDIEAGVARLCGGEISSTTATTLSASLALQSIAGILAGVARPDTPHPDRVDG